MALATICTAVSDYRYTVLSCMHFLSSVFVDLLDPHAYQQFFLTSLRTLAAACGALGAEAEVFLGRCGEIAQTYGLSAPDRDWLYTLRPSAATQGDAPRCGHDRLLLFRRGTWFVRLPRSSTTV